MRQLAFTITPEMVYGKIPDYDTTRYEVIEFRPPVAGDLVMWKDGHIATTTFNHVANSPLLICRKLARKVFTFSSTGFHNPNNEWTRNKYGSFYLQTANYPEECFSLTETEE